jgi:SpoVK/Ycf46/Vps4 family AAA+-type ATPase
MTDADRAAILRATFGAGATAEAAERAAAQFRIGPRAVVRAARQANGSADLWRACRAACAAELSALGRRVAPRFGWDDLVLPDRTVAELRALAAQARARATVLRRWGFGARWGDAGASALFAGPSGAGKSMAAEAIARDLDLDLFRIDLSGVVSKYIGETEKNLRRVFETAEESGAVLLFDEADALFGKRSEVKDSHDRYANIEVSYLLEAMERYRGVAILTTNLKNHLDPAFQRRLSFVIDFPKPDAAARARLWRAAIPAAAPTEGLDIDRLARMELAGGSIARAALNAAYMAADAGEPLTMAHVLRAAEAEHRKLDREFRAP